MLEATVWGLIAGSSLLIGAALGLYLKIPHRTVGLITGFGAGTLVSALAFELTEEAFALGGADIVAIGLAAGALTYYAGDRMLVMSGAPDRRMMGDNPPNEVGTALLLGAVLDGVPEAMVIGISILEEGTVAVPILAAVFLSNLPEALSGSSTMRDEHRGRTLAMWGAVTLVCGLAATAGFAFLDGASGDTIGFIQAFAGGAVLMTIANAMLPEAHELGGRAAGLLTVLGFAVAYLLSMI